MELLTYVGLFAAVVVTWVAVSGPGEAALVGAGTFAVGREAEIVAVLAVAFLGTLAGSVVAYLLGRAAGRRLLLRRGPLLRWRTRALARSEALVQRRSFLAAVLAPGWFVGMNEISPRPFLAGSAVSGLAWTLAIGLGAFLVGPSLVAAFDAVGQWTTIAVAGGTGIAATVLLLRRRSRSS